MELGDLFGLCLEQLADETLMSCQSQCIAGKSLTAGRGNVGYES